MKLNITVDVDWIEEDGSIEDEMRLSIEQGIINSISKKCISKIEKKANEQINLSLGDAQKIIEGKALDFVETWLEKEVSVTDKWGETIETCSIEGLIKKTFDDTLNKPVDEYGKFTNSSYNSKGSLIKYLTGSMVEEHVSKKLKDFNKEIDAAITKSVNNGIKKNVSDKFAEMVVNTARDNQRAIAAS